MEGKKRVSRGELKDKVRNRLTYKLLNIEAIDYFSDKVRNFVCAGSNLGAHQFKFNYTARNSSSTQLSIIYKWRANFSQFK